MAKMEMFNWYQILNKPSWAPPGWVFGPVWTVLYAIIIVTFGWTAYLFLTRKIPFVVFLPFILNLVFNLAFTPLQFSLRNNLLASVDVVLVLITLVWALWAIWPYARWIAFANIPYLLWVIFASILQINITYLN